MTFGRLIAFGGVLLFAFLGFFQLAFSQGQVDSRRQKLEQDLSNLEKEIEEQKKVIEVKKNEGATIARDVSILDARIKSSDLSIRARDLSIQKLTQEIAGKREIIQNLSDKLEREEISLAQILRKRSILDRRSFPEIILSGGTLSQFFADADAFSVLERELTASFEVIQKSRSEREGEKEVLEEKRLEEKSLRELQALERKRIDEYRQDKKELLALTKGVEKAYASIVKQKELSAAQIRAELFQLRGSAAIPFERALALANKAKEKTGVRPAFLLGIIAEETNLGANIGTGNWRVDMHPTRDQPIFEVITRSLGLNPDTVPVSKKAWYGWGGAMGPAQFIPSTWVSYGGFVKSGGTWVYESSKDKVRNLTNKNSPSNPWDPEDAFMASAMLLRDSGAAKGGVSNERYAALCYLAGCRNANKKAYAFYADDVMDLAEKYERQIAILRGA